ncbi:MAG: tetratricopeptide repeat protein [Spirochaetales bacterium]|nr:tetratricopeptide repeat protein [Spirochaetales bacterium]
MKKTDLSQLFEQAKLAGRNRDYETAVELFSELIRRTDQFPEALMYLGRSYHALGEFDRAVLLFRFYLNIEPDSVPAHFFIGRTYCALGFYRRAARHFRRLLKKNPDFIPALPFIGLSLLKLHRPDLALPYFEKAVEAEPDNTRIYNAYMNCLLVYGIRLFNRKDPDAAAEVFGFLIKQRQDTILPYIYLAIISRETGDLETSLLYYDEAIRISPNDPTFRLHKAHLYFKLQDNNRALGELEQAQKLMGTAIPGMQDPAKLLKLIAVTHYREKRYREAIYFARQVLKTNYKDVDMHMLIAEAYRYFEEFEKAKNHYLRAWEADPSRIETLHGLTVVLWEIKDYSRLLARARQILQQNPDDATGNYFYVLALSELDSPPEDIIPLLQEEIRRQGPDAHLMFGLGKSYVAGGRQDLAEGWLVRTLKIDQEHPDALLLLADVYDCLKKTKQERETLKKYIDLYTDDIPVRKKYVRLLLAENLYSLAAPQLSTLLTHEPNNKMLKKTLGVCYQKTGKFSEAIIIFKDLIKEDPKSVTYLRQLIFCLDQMNNRKAAILIMESAVKYLKETSDLLLPLGVLYVKEKNFEKATDIFRKVISANPKDWRAYMNMGMVYKKMKNKSFADKFLKKAEELRNIKEKAKKQ